MHPPPAWPADFSMVVPNSLFNLASMIIYHQFQDSYSRTKTTYASQMRVWKSFWQFPLRQPTRTLSRSRILFFFRYVNNDWVVANHKQVWVDWFLLCPIVATFVRSRERRVTDVCPVTWTSPWCQVRLQLYATSLTMVLRKNRHDQQRNVFTPRSDRCWKDVVAQTSTKYPLWPCEFLWRKRKYYQIA